MKQYVWQLVTRIVDESVDTDATQTSGLFITNSPSDLDAFKQARAMYSTEFWNMAMITEMYYLGQLMSPLPDSEAGKELLAKGRQEMLGSVCASLADYPNAGGDVNVMMYVDRIRHEMIGQWCAQFGMSPEEVKSMVKSVLDTMRSNRLGGL